jgi:hypothetical protein
MRGCVQVGSSLVSFCRPRPAAFHRHGSLDRRAFRWTNVYRALDFILDGIKP